MKKLFGGCFLLILLLIGVGLYFVSTLPKELSVARSLDIAAKPEVIHPMIEDLHRWPEWSSWDEEEPEMTKTRKFEGSEKGEGAISSWVSSSGPGTMTITASDPEKGVWYDLAFGEPAAQMLSKGAVTYELQGEMTRVTFEMRGDLDGTGQRIIGAMMKPMIAESFEKNLRNLAKVAEAK